MKVWVCTHGQYSDTSIRGVFSSEELANRAAEAFGWNDHTEEFELDEIAPEAKDGCNYYVVGFYFKSGNVQESVSVECDEPSEYHKEGFTKLRSDGGRNFWCYQWARDKDHALKIGADKLAASQSDRGAK